MPDLSGYNVLVCSCPEGPYYGAQMMGTVTKCERCGFMTQEQLDRILVRFAERGRELTGMTEESRYIWVDPEDGTQIVWSGSNPPQSCILMKRYVTDWRLP
jgi:hypothetical protein